MTDHSAAPTAAAASPVSPIDVDAVVARALALRAAGLVADAAVLALTLARQNATPQTLINAGGLLVEAGRSAEALPMLRQATTTEAPPVQGWWWLGLALLEQGQPRAAADSLRRVIDDPQLGAGARAALGRAMLAAERPAAAVEALTPAATGGHPLLALELSQALEALGRVSEAETALRRAAAAPDAPQLLAALARLSAAQGRLDAAVDLLAQARAVAGRLSGPAAALGWLAVAGESERWSGAAAGEADLRAAVAADPDHPAPKLVLAQRLLRRGDWAEGWALYRERPSAQRFNGQRATTPAPASLTGARVVVVPDQGVGDEMFFWRFIPELLRRGAVVALAASAKTASLARRLGLFEQVAVDGVGVRGAVDHVVVDGDLPWWLGWEGIAPSLRLAPTDAAVATAEAALAAAGSRPWTGTLWRGGAPGGVWRGGAPGAAVAGVKRAPRAALLELLRRRPGGVAFFQRNVEAEELAAAEAALGRPAADCSRLTDDLETALAALSLLDAYVGVSTADCHLLALLGRGGRALSPYPGDFRWGESGDASPWFPGFTVYREDAQAGWGDALGCLRRDLG